MTVRDGAIDAWMQHPTAEFLALPMFDSLRRWSHGALPQGDLPVSWTIDRMDRAGVGHGMLCAWWGPSGPLIPNEAVGELVLAHPDRFSMVAAVDLHRPMAGVHELHRVPAQPWAGQGAIRFELPCVARRRVPRRSTAARPRHRDVVGVPQGQRRRGLQARDSVMDALRAPSILSRHTVASASTEWSTPAGHP